jgi:tetratricopeptide (TPR) repeat protein
MQKTDNVERARKLVEKAREAEQLEENGKALSLYDDALSEFTAESLDPSIPEVLRWKGTLLREKGETEAAFRCYTMSLDRARLIGSEAAQAHALNCLGTVAQRRCDLKETERLYAEAAELATRAGDSRLLGMIEQNRGVLASMRGDFAQAAAFYSNSLGAFEMACDQEPMSWVLNNLGILHTKIRNYGDARDYLERGLAIAINRDDAVVENVPASPDPVERRRDDKSRPRRIEPREAARRQRCFEPESLPRHGGIVRVSVVSWTFTTSTPTRRRPTPCSP